MPKAPQYFSAKTLKTLSVSDVFRRARPALSRDPLRAEKHCYSQTHHTAKHNLSCESTSHLIKYEAVILIKISFSSPVLIIWDLTRYRDERLPLPIAHQLAVLGGSNRRPPNWHSASQQMMGSSLTRYYTLDSAWVVATATHWTSVYRQKYSTININDISK